MFVVCLANFSKLQSFTLGLNLGICIPNTCSLELINDLLKSAISDEIDLPIALSMDEDHCHQQDGIHYSVAAIFTM